MSESELGFKDSLKILKSTLGPLFMGVLTIAAAKTKDIDKRDKKTAIAGFGGMTLFAGLLTKFDIEELKETKQKVSRALDEMTNNVNSLIEQFRYVKKQGAKSTSDLSIDYDRNRVTKKREIGSTWNRLSKTIKPVEKLKDDISKSEIARYVDQMQRETVAFLKRYVNDSEFKTTFEKYLYRLDIRATDYADVFSVTITDYQNGIDIDSDDINIDWYDELLEVGEKFIEKRFDAWNGIVWNYIEFGDGDEGTIYVN